MRPRISANVYKVFLVLGAAVLGLGARTPCLAAPITVYGRVLYESKLFNETGEGDPNRVSEELVRFAQLQIVDSATRVILASGETRFDGTYRIVLEDPAGAIFVRVLARADSPEAKVRVLTDTFYQQLWAARSSTFTPSGGDVQIRFVFSASSQMGEVFNIFDTIVDGAQVVKANSGRAPPMVTAYWNAGSSDGTYFNSADDSIHLLGLTQNSDGYDDGVILQEYGHFILKQFSIDRSPGGLHRFTDTNQDPRLSWAEGWSNFFSCWVRRDPRLVDVLGSSFSRVNLESLSELIQELATGQDTESAVMAVLWDLWDPSDGTNERHDAVQLYERRVWEVINFEIPPTADGVMEDFYNALVRRHGTRELELIQRIFAERSIFYSNPLFQRGPIFAQEVGLGVRDFDPPGLVSRLAIPSAGTMARVHIFLDISHQFRSDLVVQLKSPAGTTILIQNRDPPRDLQPGDNETDYSPSIFGWYQAFENISQEPLAKFRGELGQGIWELKVADVVPVHGGSLNRWRLEMVENHPPQLDVATNLIVQEGQSLSFRVEALDPEGDPVSLSASNLPAGATFDETEGIFRWRPSFEQSGVYEVTFTASDGLASSQVTVNITVQKMVRVVLKLQTG